MRMFEIDEPNHRMQLTGPARQGRISSGGGNWRGLCDMPFSGRL